MLENYFPILLFVLVGLAVGVGPLVLGKLVSPNRPDAAKNSPYECGFEAFEDARMKFDVRYYLVAILFILFDYIMAAASFKSFHSVQGRSNGIIIGIFKFIYYVKSF